VNDLLVLLGKRVHALRAARKWSQEEFAHVSGLHRTYIGQIERGEKNFGNLSKISSVLGVTLSELLSGLEDGGASDKQSQRRRDSGNQKADDATQRMLQLQKLVRRLKVQVAAMDRTVVGCEKFVSTGDRTPKPSGRHQPSGRTRSSKR